MTRARPERRVTIAVRGRYAHHRRKNYMMTGDRMKKTKTAPATQGDGSARERQEFVREIAHVDIVKHNHAETRDRGIRLYCSASAEVHGGDEARYALQIFAPMKFANGQEGRGDMIATASMSPRDLVALRAEIDMAITEVEEICPHATSPRYASDAADSVIP